MAWADSHCHLHDAKVSAGFPLLDAAEAGVRRLITVGCDEPTSAAAIAAAHHGDVEVWATAGLHPHDAKDGWRWLDAMLALAPANRVVAVGECGLDYHYDHSPRDVQRACFAAQIGLAHQFDLPLVIHTRNAWDESFAILASEGVPARTIFHCFTGGPAEAEQCLALGAYLSFSGIITFKTATDIRAAARLTPLDRVLVETDSPYLAPVPHRGKINRPAWVPFVGACLADVLGEDVATVEAATWANCTEAFRLHEAIHA